MNEQQHIEKAHTLAAEWFKDHKAAWVTNEHDPARSPIVAMDWRRERMSSYAIRFAITQNCVVVTGDVGNAIYGGWQSLTLDALLRFDWHYFVNKCVASETGRSYTMKVPGIKHPVVNVRAIGHFVGLQMALKQLKAQPAIEWTDKPWPAMELAGGKAP